MAQVKNQKQNADSVFPPSTQIKWNDEIEFESMFKIKRAVRYAQINNFRGCRSADEVACSLGSIFYSKMVSWIIIITSQPYTPLQ